MHLLFKENLVVWNWRGLCSVYCVSTVCEDVSLKAIKLSFWCQDNQTLMANMGKKHYFKAVLHTSTISQGQISWGVVCLSILSINWVYMAHGWIFYNCVPFLILCACLPLYSENMILVCFFGNYIKFTF